MDPKTDPCELKATEINLNLENSSRVRNEHSGQSHTYCINIHIWENPSEYTKYYYQIC